MSCDHVVPCCNCQSLVVLDYWTGGEIQLLGLSVGGQLRRITVHNKTEKADLSSGPTVQVGHSVRDHLSAIGDVCERYRHMIPI